MGVNIILFTIKYTDQLIEDMNKRSKLFVGKIFARMLVSV